ncbi:MAG: hypothetical protein P4M11_14440 [Candidatus Pacebacteria bacterium]|nr:hypothetical protein [Candidatus Paceibacterota bacterium]
MDAKEYHKQKSGVAKTCAIPLTQRNICNSMEVVEAPANLTNVLIRAQPADDVKRFVSCNHIIVPERVTIPTGGHSGQSNASDKSHPEESAKDLITKHSFDASMLNSYNLQAGHEPINPSRKPPKDALIFIGLFASLALLVRSIIECEDRKRRLRGGGLPRRLR